MGMNELMEEITTALIRAFQSTHRWGFLKLQLSVETLRSVLILHLQG